MINYTIDEVSLHNTENDAWIIINNSVYDITDFINQHPGGKDILLQLLGTDATNFFNELHHPSVLEEYAENYKIGELN